MQFRATLIGLFVIVALCAGGLFAVFSYFGRDAEMRSAELAYQAAHADEIASAQARHAARHADEPGGGVDYGGGSEKPASEEEIALDDWYASAGTDEGPFDPTPEDNSWLINDAQPIE